MKLSSENGRKLHWYLDGKYLGEFSEKHLEIGKGSHTLQARRGDATSSVIFFRGQENSPVSGPFPGTEFSESIPDRAFLLPEVTGKESGRGFFHRDFHFTDGTGAKDFHFDH